MQKEVQEIIRQLDLKPHPEGGFYRETYRSDLTIPGTKRQLTTVIYFLLTSGNVSRFHRIKSDEHWFFHAGSPLIIHTLDEKGHNEYLLGTDFSLDQQPQFVVPANTIFGSSVLYENAYSLVSCVVSPGFDFEDFELFSTDQLLSWFPDHETIIRFLS